MYTHLSYACSALAMPLSSIHLLVMQASPFCHLHWAAIFNCVDAANMLLSYGAEIHVEDFMVGLYSAMILYIVPFDGVSDKLLLCMYV